ncbi:hypothetical protein B0I00_1864 [Novosphingobium kunmingense]|uniref:Uncharacterized protein n=1 Tax=Novosphingobium kunmingense TaxID=1211806 RepID=A0A2N0HL73_9SPHN|nr:hypothetical protein [Novosphingobium kunmingense]PKB19625.1 hypothetical protein B0I00_1864 [Novosphingobium kunmingense]
MIDLSLGTDAREVVLALATQRDDHRPYVRTIAADCDLPVEQVRRILFQLGEHGLATFGPVFDSDDGTPKGSTWWLTEAGTAVRDTIEQGKAA